MEDIKISDYSKEEQLLQMYRGYEPTKKKIPLITLFQKNSGGLSSKRVCGVIGWIVIMFCCIWCVIKGVNAPDFATELIIGCISLLGVDSVSDAIGGIRRR